MNGKVASWDSFLLDGLFRMFDTDKSGGITFEEFVTNLSIYHAKVDSKETDDCRDKLMFQIYDVDQDNLISAADLSNVLTDCLNSNHMFLGEVWYLISLFFCCCFFLRTLLKPKNRNTSTC